MGQKEKDIKHLLCADDLNELIERIGKDNRDALGKEFGMFVNDLWRGLPDHCDTPEAKTILLRGEFTGGEHE